MSVATVAGDDGAPVELATGRQAYFLAIMVEIVLYSARRTCAVPMLAHEDDAVQ